MLGGDFLEVFQDVITPENPLDLSKSLSIFERKLQDEFSSDRLHVNGSAVLLSTLTKNGSHTTRKLKNLHVNECTLTGPLEKCIISSSEIYRLDGRGADFSEIDFEETNITMLITDSLTRFGKSTPNISTIHFIDGYNIETLHSPTEIDKWIHEHSDQDEEDPYQDLAFYKFFEKVCRRAIRQFYFRYGEHDPDPVSEFLVDEKWPVLADIFRKHDRLDEVYKQVSGPPSLLYHVRDPQSMLSPTDPSAKSVRQDVIAAARSWS
ncbi:hypothetical protein D3C76_749570 [compost metagenome]